MHRIRPSMNPHRRISIDRSTFLAGTVLLGAATAAASVVSRMAALNWLTVSLAALATIALAGLARPVAARVKGR